MDAWGEAEKFPVGKAFEMGILPQLELDDITERIKSYS